jgi:hypothetical protein
MIMKLAFCVLFVWLAAGQTAPQADDYPRERENALHRTTPAKRLFPEDLPCGGYLWKSEHTAELHMVALYYFFGSTEYGKSKMGLYPQSKYRAVVNEQADPPTAQAIMEDGKLKEIRIQMTSKEYESARQCFPAK